MSHLILTSSAITLIYNHAPTNFIMYQLISGQHLPHKMLQHLWGVSNVDGLIIYLGIDEKDQWEAAAGGVAGEKRDKCLKQDNVVMIDTIRQITVRSPDQSCKVLSKNQSAHWSSGGELQ